MGSKTQPNAKDSKEKRPVFRCDDCERDFLTLAALKSHMMAKHPEKYKQMLSHEAQSKEEKKTAFVPPTSRVSKRLQQKKSIDNEVVITPSSRKTVFQCPECLKEFGVFFPAHRHIQNRHCVDKHGNPVSPDSLDLIQPIRKEICTACDKAHGDQPCGGVSSKASDNGTYCCLACKQTFQTVTSFDEHVETDHSDSVIVVVMENMKEFLTWKTTIETKQHVKYLTLSNTTQKQYYQCNYVSPQNSADVTHLCPSVMITREAPKGIHVRYHKDHHEHICEKYVHQPIVKNPIIDHNDVFEDIVKSGVDVYVKLKDLMKSIAQQAGALKKTKLKPLYLSALDMQVYINSLDDNDDEKDTSKRHSISNNVEKTDDANKEEIKDVELKSNKIMTDDQILKALEGKRIKRKSEAPIAPEPKMKQTKKSETKKSLKENSSPVDLICSERFESPKPNIPSPFTQSPSFNDSYKKFIDSTSPKTEVEKKPKRGVKKEVVKTKMGQFTPSPKKTVTFEPENVGGKKKKKVPAKTTPLKDLKLEDVEYEVVEQENDCNILILKI